MNALAPSSLRPSRFERVSFEAWHIHGDGVAQRKDCFGRSIAEIAAAYACEGTFGHILAVRETDEISAASAVHFFQIRRGKWLGRYNDLGSRKVYPHHAAPLFKVQVSAFDPVEPWRWVPGCDVVGRDPNVVEARP